MKENRVSNRRGFFHKLVRLGVAGSIAALLFQREKMLVPSAEAGVDGDIIIGVLNAGPSTGLFGPGGVPGMFGLFNAFNVAPTQGLVGTTEALGPPAAPAPAGVHGVANLGIGLWGQSNGTGVLGEATGSAAIPIVARGAASQTGNLQEWQSSAPATLSAVDSGGKLGIGTSSPSAPLHMYFNVPTMVIAEADGSSPCVLQLDTYGTGSITSGGGFLGRFAHGSKASPSDVANGDRLGFNIFGGYAGGAFRHTGGIEGVVESGTISGSSLPTGIRFLTTPNGSVSRQERMRIDNAGNVVPPSDGAGSIGTASKRWGLIRGVTVQSGDLAFENDFRVTEDEKVGLAFLNDSGEKIAVLDRGGNLRIKGDVIKDPTL